MTNRHVADPAWLINHKLRNYSCPTQASSPSIEALKAEIGIIVNKLRAKDEYEGEQEERARIARIAAFRHKRNVEMTERIIRGKEAEDETRALFASNLT